MRGDIHPGETSPGGAKNRRGPISPTGDRRLALRSKGTRQRIRLSDDQSPAVAEDRRRKRKRGIKTGEVDRGSGPS